MPGISCVCVLPAAIKEKRVNTIYMTEVVIQPLSAFVSYGFLHHWGPDVNEHRILRYHLYLIPSDVQLNDAITFAYGNSLTAEATTRADWKTAVVVKTRGQQTNDLETKEGANAREIGNYFISSEIL